MKKEIKQNRCFTLCVRRKKKMNFELANANSGQSTTVFKSEHVLALAVFQGKPDESAFDHFFKGKSADFDWYEALKVGFKDVRNALFVVVNYRHGTLFTLDIGHVARAHFFVGDECTNLFIEDSDVRKVFFCVSLSLPRSPLFPPSYTLKKIAQARCLVRKSFPKVHFATIVVTNIGFWDVWQPDELYCVLLSRTADKHATVPEIAFETYKKRKQSCLFSKFTIQSKSDASTLSTHKKETPLENKENKLVVRRGKRSKHLDFSLLKPYFRLPSP